MYFILCCQVKIFKMTKMRFLTPVRRAISLLFVLEGVGWRLPRHPSPSHTNSTQNTVIQSEAKNQIFFTGQQYILL